MPTEILSLGSDAFLAQAPRLCGINQQQAAEVWRRAVQSGVMATELLPAESRTKLAAQYCLTLPELDSDIQDSSAQLELRKFILKLGSGLTFETVAFPFGEQLALCISSQVGCKMACSFCETGRLGLLHNLSTAEIISQIVVAHQQLGRKADRIVFMGMGEALDNVEAVIGALHILTDKRGWAYARERLTVCTSGHEAGLLKLQTLGWKRLNVSLSLNATTDEARNELMPVNRRTPLKRLQELLVQYRPRKNFCFGINYCLLPGINDSRDDATRIAEFCAPLGRVLINLIPYNPGNAPITRTPTGDEVDNFISWLRAEGLPVRRRITKGRDIMAACGQLGDVRQRKRKAY